VGVTNRPGHHGVQFMDPLGPKQASGRTGREARSPADPKRQSRPEGRRAVRLDEVTGHCTVGGGTGEHGQFQLRVDASGAAFTLDRLFIEVFEISARDGSEINKLIVPAIYGPLIVDGYIGYRGHVVESGDTLSAIAATHYGDSALYPRIVRANPSISDPDVIFPGQLLRIPIGS
jgi:phage tail protein X